MQMLLLPELASGRPETGFRSDRQAGKSESSFTGTILAGRYKILEAIEAESFKAHDLALDQTVTVRVVFPSSQRVGDIWRREVLFTEARRSFAVNAWESSLSEAPPFFVKLVEAFFSTWRQQLDPTPESRENGIRCWQAFWNIPWHTPAQMTSSEDSIVIPTVLPRDS